MKSIDCSTNKHATAVPHQIRLCILSCNRTWKVSIAVQINLLPQSLIRSVYVYVYCHAIEREKYRLQYKQTCYRSPSSDPSMYIVMQQNVKSIDSSTNKHATAVPHQIRLCIFSCNRTWKVSIAVQTNLLPQSLIRSVYVYCHATEREKYRLQYKRTYYRSPSSDPSMYIVMQQNVKSIDSSTNKHATAVPHQIRLCIFSCNRTWKVSIAVQTNLLPQSLIRSVYVYCHATEREKYR